MFEERITTSKAENSKNTIIGIRIFSTSLLVLASLMLNTESILAQSLTSQRTLSFDSRYFIRTNSNRAVGQFGIDMVNLATLPADLIGPGSRLRNVGQGLVLLFTASYLTEGFSLAYHEYGHGTRNSAIGFRSLYAFGTAQNDAMRAKTYDNIFSFYLRTFYKNGGFTLRTSENAHFTPFTEEEQWELRWNILRRAGGMNNEMVYTELIEDEVYRHGGHIGFLTAYLKGKLSPSHFSDSAGEFGDLNRVVAAYEEHGFRLDKDQIDSGSQIAFYFSAMTYQLFYQTFRMFTGKSYRFQPWEYRGLQLPNTSFYMTRSGLSHKVRSAYRSGSWRFPFAVEHVFEGNRRTEVSFGAEKQYERVEYGLTAIIGKQLEMELDVGYRLDKWFLISAGYALYDVRNLHGERLIPSLEHGSTYHDFYLRASLTY